MQTDYFPDSSCEEVLDYYDVVPGDLFDLRFKSNAVLRVVIIAPKRVSELEYKGCSYVSERV